MAACPWMALPLWHDAMIAAYTEGEEWLEQLKDYLDGRITKEEYYNQAEPFYTEYANTYENPLFHKCFNG